MVKRETSEQTISSVADRSSASPTDGSARVTENDIARRAYELYIARNGGHGHDVEDWLQAERELRGTGPSLAA